MAGAPVSSSQVAVGDLLQVVALQVEPSPWNDSIHADTFIFSAFSGHTMDPLTAYG